MDLLNSILNSMDKPPSASERQKELLKKHKKYNEEIINKQKEELSRFRKYTQERISRFAKDDRLHIEFQPQLDKIHRSIIHEVAENGGFIAMSFGVEDVDRYTVVYKKETPPTEDEITARRNGEEWNAEVAKEYAKRRLEQQKCAAEEQIERLSKSTKQKTEKQEDEAKPTTYYKDKYAHLIGQSAAKEAARKTETNQSYGFVPSKNKKDMRSIEQTLADIQAKKRLKLQLEQQPGTEQCVNIQSEIISQSQQQTDH